MYYISVLYCTDLCRVGWSIWCGEISDRKSSRRKRAAAVKLGLQLQAEGDYAGADRALRAGTDITPAIARQVIVHLNGLPKERKEELGFVAAYTALGEADPMLVWVHRHIPNSCIVSSDYDMVPWGADRVLFKVNYVTGPCMHA